MDSRALVCPFAAGGTRRGDAEDDSGSLECVLCLGLRSPGPIPIWDLSREKGWDDTYVSDERAPTPPLIFLFDRNARRLVRFILTRTGPRALTRFVWRSID